MGVHPPQDVVIGSVQLQRRGGVSEGTSLPASFLFPFVRQSVNPGPAIPISQGICAKLEGGLGVPAFRIGLGLAAELEMKT